MTAITSLFLVLTLTGSPVLSIACFAECERAPMPTGHCHDDAATENGPMVSAGFACSSPAIGEGTYLTEHRAVPGAAVLTTTSSTSMFLLVRAGAPAVPSTSARAWQVPRLVLRI